MKGIVFFAPANVYVTLLVASGVASAWQDGEEERDDNIAKIRHCVISRIGEKLPTTNTALRTSASHRINQPGGKQGENPSLNGAAARFGAAKRVVHLCCERENGNKDQARIQ